MAIVNAELTQAETVKNIVHSTINAVYPHYYPAGAVRFFLEHHSDSRIVSDIAAGKVYLLLADDGTPAGTVTVNGNDIGRLFVDPDHQGRGFGGELLRFAEDIIFADYDEVVLDSSFPAKPIYLKKGYVSTKFNTIEAYGDYLCFDSMSKKR